MRISCKNHTSIFSMGKRSNSSIIKSYNNSKNDSDRRRKTVCYSKDVGIDHYGKSLDSILKYYP